MELRHLRAFVAVARGSSFTAAADELMVVQSAVSATIRGLEQELGVELFDRSTRHVELSDAGRILLPEARRTLQAAALAVDAVQQARSGLRGSVTVGVMQAAAQPGISVASFIARFRDSHPAVEVTARHVGGSLVLAQQTLSGDVDVAILSLTAPLSGLNLTPLSSEPMALTCASGHHLASRSTVALGELVREPFADGPSGWGIRVLSDRAFADAGLARTLAYEINDTTSLIDFVRAGLAVALLPRSMTASTPGLRAIPLAGKAPRFEIFLARAAERRLTAAADAFALFVQDLVAGRAAQ